jgi:hypothetical protein
MELRYKTILNVNVIYGHSLIIPAFAEAYKMNVQTAYRYLKNMADWII